MKTYHSKKVCDTAFYEQKEFDYKYKNIRIVEDENGNKHVERLDAKKVYENETEKMKFENKIKPPKMNLRRAGDVKR